LFEEAMKLDPEERAALGEATTAHLLRTAEEVSRAGVEVDVREYVEP
jgi:hypothetical protein